MNRYIKEKKILFTINFLVWLIAHSFPLFLGILIQNMLSLKITIYVGLIIFLVLILLQIAFIYLGAKTDYAFKKYVQSIFFNNVYTTVINRNIHFQSIVEIINADISKITYFFMTIIDTTVQVIITLVMFLYLSTLNMLVAVTLFIYTVLTVLITMTLKEKMSHNIEKVNTIADDIVDFENSLKLNTYAYTYHFEALDKMYHTKYKLSKKQLRYRVLLNFFSSYSAYLILTIVYGVMTLTYNQFDVSVFLVAVLYIPTFNGVTTYVVNFISVFYELKASEKRIKTVLGEKFLYEDTKLEDFIIDKTYQLPNIQFTGIKGKNASGKSRFIKNEYLFRENVAVINQSSKLFHGKISDNLSKYPFNEKLWLGMGLEDVSQERLITELSGGEKDRIMIYRALVSKKQLIVIDHMFKGIDHDTLAKLLDVLQSTNKTFLIITTSNFILSKCDEIITL